MTFTDDELKRLKERLADKVRDSHEDFWPIMHGYFIALITRLEAAEACIYNGECESCVDLGCHHDRLLERWKKSAGKI